MALLLKSSKILKESVQGVYWSKFLPARPMGNLHLINEIQYRSIADIIDTQERLVYKPREQRVDVILMY